MKIPTSKRPEFNEVLDDGLPPILSWKELCAQADQIRAWYDERIIFDGVRGTCTLLFEYPYEIDLDDIKGVRDLLDWTLHLLEKGLEGQDVETIIKRIAKFKKIKIYR